MLQLQVTAPGGRKAEVECEPSATFGDVKARIQTAFGVPQDKQRLFCNRKERKNAAETLASAGVTSKTKLMLMLAPGFEMPPEPTTSAASTEASEAPAAEDEGPPVDIDGELPLPAGADASAAGSSALVHVRQGRHRYHVRIPQGLAEATFGELADYLAASLLFPPGVPSGELRFITKGKTPARSDALGSADGKEITVMLLFREGFHLAAEGAAWLRERSTELSNAEAEIEKLAKRIEANFSDAETSVRLAEVGGLIEILKQSVDSVRVREVLLTEMASFRDRVHAAHDRLEVLRKGVRL
mmetsp:Transcript_27460/g.50051  ORF Transcript_27460/g.50051 Transcript_27460/m.50051 type:complete len:300 (+) Transcript_27460:99-998(+)